MKFIWAANWKLNKTPQETIQTTNEFLEQIPSDLHSQVILLPQNFSVGLLSPLITRTSLRWGAQNIYHEAEGAFTGENSPKVLKDLGASHCLVGHSERRKLFLESDEVLARKVAAAQKFGLSPILCIGESDEERSNGKTNEVIRQQLEKGLSLCDFQKSIVIAYEPVWAIGTGKVASVEQVNDAHNFIRLCLNEMTTKDFAERIAILYGGSVKVDSASSLSKVPNVNGFLVGGASLKASDFTQIINASL